jgi:hypothetical protein
MYRSLLFSIFLFFAFTCINGQKVNPGCAHFTGGIYIKGNYTDSIVVYRGLEYWMEADMKAHECRVYKIGWTDACNFTLFLNTRINENKGYYLRKALADSLFFTTESSDSTGITYRVKDGKNVTNIKLKPFYDTLAWEYLVYADTNLYFDTTEIKQLYGTPPRNYYYNTPSFINLETDSTDNRFVIYVISLFQNGDIKPTFNFASSTLKNHSPEAVLEDYNHYVQQLYGKLKSFKAASISEGYKINKSLYSHYYIINGDFEKLSKGASICISTAPGGTTPLLSLSVTIDNAGKISFLNELTHPFWDNLKHKKYRKIYDNSSAMLKQSITFEKVQQALEAIDSSGHLDEYKIFFQNFSVNNGQGFLLLSYKCPLQNKTPVINLFYIFENGEYKLSSVNTSKS